MRGGRASGSAGSTRARGRRFQNLLLCVVPAVMWLIAAGPDVAAIESAVILDVAPATIKLASGDTASVFVVVRNETDAPIANPTVSGVANAGVTLDPPRLSFPDLPPGASDQMTVGVTPTEGGDVEGTVTFLLTFQGGGDGSGAVSGVVVATLTVQERTLKEATELASATIASTMTRLTDRRGGVVFVQVKNVANVPISVAEVAGTAPPFVSLCTPVEEGKAEGAEDSGCPAGEAPVVTPDTKLAPRESATYAFSAVARPEETIQTGKQLLLFDVKVSKVPPGPSRSSIVLQHEFEVAVFGETEILTPLGVSSFLLLPGFLVVVTIRGLWQYLWPRHELAFLKVTSPEFWLAAITISLLAIPVYDALTALTTVGPGGGRDLLDGYDSRDLFMVWGGSIVGGIVLWGLFSAIVPRVKRWWSRRRTFISGDGPRRVIAKVARRGDSLVRPQVQLSLGGGNIRALVLSEETATKPDGRLVVAPPIRYRFGKSAGADFKSELRSSILGDEAQRVRRLIGIAPWDRKVDLHWNVPGSVPAVTPVPASSVAAGPNPGPRTLLEEDTT